MPTPLQRDASFRHPAVSVHARHPYLVRAFIDAYWLCALGLSSGYLRPAGLSQSNPATDFGR